MAFLELVQELYKSMETDLDSHLEFCRFSVLIDNETLEHNINRYAEKEEPSAVLCIAKAKANGNSGILDALAGSSVDTFFFTSQVLYLQSNAFHFSEIHSIKYQTETKTGFFGGTKTKNYLVVSKKSGQSEKFNGCVAEEPIAKFLDAIVKKYADHPPAEPPAQNFPRSKLIVDALSSVGSSLFKTKPNLNDCKINSILIKLGMFELKASFAASYKNELFFSNDNLYYSENGEFKKIPYNQLEVASYSEIDSKKSDGEITTAKTLSLHAKDGKVIFKNESFIAKKEVADFFNKIISDATGTEVKTESNIQKMKQSKTSSNNSGDMKSILGLVGKGLLNFTAETFTGSAVSSAYHLVLVSGDKKSFQSRVNEWNEIFKRNAFFENAKPSISFNTLPEYFGQGDKKLLASNGQENILYYFDTKQYYFLYKPSESKEYLFSFSLLDYSAYKGRFPDHGALDGAGHRGSLAGYLKMSSKDGSSKHEVSIHLMEVSGWTGSSQPLKELLDKSGNSGVYNTLQNFVGKLKGFVPAGGEAAANISGSVVSENEEERKNWNTLLDKWNDIFSKDVSIEYRKFSDDEIKKLPEWMHWDGIREEFFYFMGNAVFSINSYSGNYAYFPDPFAKTKKIIYWLWDEEEFNLDLELKNGDVSIWENSEYIGKDSINLENFLKILQKESIANNHAAFKKKLDRAKTAYKENEKKLEEKRQQEEEAKRLAEQKKAEEKRNNAIDDLSNW